MLPIKIFIRDDERVPERSDHAYECTLVDRAGAPIQAAAISAISCSLSDVDTGTPLGGRINQSVLNTNGGTVTAAVDGSALFSLGLDPSDAPIVDASKKEEKHRLVLAFTYARATGGEGALRHQVEYYVVNLAHTP